jgi:hypothetical protein
MLLVRESVLASLFGTFDALRGVVLGCMAGGVFLLAQIRHCYVKRCMILPCVAVIVFLGGIMRLDVVLKYLACRSTALGQKPKYYQCVILRQVIHRLKV